MLEFLYQQRNVLTEEISRNIIDVFNNDTTMNEYGEINLYLDMKPYNIWYNNKNNILNILLVEIEKYFSFVGKTNVIVDNLKSKINSNCFTAIKYRNETNKFLLHPSCTRYFDNLIKHNSKYNIFTFIFFVNDVKKGGEIEFFNYYKIKPEKGKIVIFPSDWFFAHKHNIPLNEDLYIIKGFIYIDN